MPDRSGYIPKKPVGDDPFAVWAQAIHDRVFGASGQLNDSSTVTVSRNTKGISLHASAGVGGTSIQIFVLTQIFSFSGMADYIGVSQWDPQQSSVIAAQQLIAKCLSARMLSAEMIDGNEVTYSYVSDNERIANYTGYGNERQVMHPRYLVYDPDADPDDQPPQESIIYLSSVQGGTDVQDENGNWLQQIEMQPIRFWTRSNDQSDL